MTGEPDPRTLRLAREAEGYYELELFEDALDRAERLLAEGLHEDFALAMKAECLRSLDRFAEGVPAYEEILRRTPGSVAAYVGLGWCLKRSGRLDLALRAMERLLEARPGAGIGLYNLACYSALAGERARALDLLARAIDSAREYRDLAAGEEDFEALRDDPDFRRILESPGG